uniref:Reverse transcriptase domain-containing protein n=1 Tax=Tanacetum cinerariifolium TaxID=118510 RepID=A0A699GNH1_TANCI|nr:hypothetical protein [Tanacetum cinerariifolium]
MDVSMDSTNKDYISTVLESVKANSLASKISNIDGKILPRRYTTYQEPLKDAGSSKSNISNVKDKVDTIHKPSFTSVVHEKPQKTIIKIKEMRNKVSVNGVAVTIPMEAVESVNARFVNTLYGYFIGDRLAFPLVENYVKNTWAKSAYARVLIEIAADVELVKSLIIAIHVGNKEEHTFATIDIEYEWTPPRCASCRIFDHVSEKCPKLPKVASNEKVIEEGFIEVKKKKTKTKKKRKIQVEGVRLNKPTLNLQYQRVDKGKSSKINNGVTNKESTDKGPIQITTNNSFSALSEETDTNLKDKERGNANYQTPIESLFFNDSDEDVDEYITMEETSKVVHKVGNESLPKQNEVRQVIHDNKLSVCAIFKSHVATRNLKRLCKHVFKNWNWISNAMTCLKGTRIIVGWNQNDVDFAVIHQEPQVIHARIWIKVDRKEPWCLLGDFNAPLFVEDTSMGSSSLDVTMREFKECVENIEVMDVQRTGLQYTWNQEPKGKDGILRKLDRVLANLKFLDVFMGAHAVFKPYRISDHSPAVLFIPSLVKVKPMPFKFFNVIILDDRFKDVVVKKLKGLKKPIRKLMYDKGNLHANVVRLREELDKVAKAFINHYEIFLGQPGNTSDFNTGNLFPTTLNESEALNMVRDISSQEDIIGVDVIKAVKEFFTNGRLLMELNHTIIALIPKVNTPARVTDYTPISCCNVLFKCISKIIANHLKDSLKRLVSPNQSAFVPGRCISDNILLTQEIMHNYHLDREVSRCAFKVDIQKVYDTVDWDFLRGKRGLRQGDPLSPYLFTLIMEVFMLMLKRRVSETSTFTYHRFFSELDLINLCFADDLFLFAHGDVNSAKVIKDALDDFKDASGLNPSMPKSKAYFCNVINYTKLAILNILPFEEDCLPVKYLGVPLVSSRLISRDWRLQLIQFVLSSMHMYWASVFMLPSRMVLDIEQIMRGFLWSQDNMSKGKVKVAWDVVCLSKREGGLGIRRLDHFNKALMVSHVWKLLTLKESLWVKWIHVYKLKNRSFWDIPMTFMWFDKWCVTGPLSNIISSRDITRAGFDHASKVRECIQDGLWIWPNDWLVKYPILNSIPISVISDDNFDYLEWCCRDGMGKPLSVHNIWDSIRPRDNPQRLRTQDCLRSWEVNSDLAVVCPLCETQPDSHEHLFFYCTFSQQVWSLVQQIAGLTGASPSLASIITHLLPIAKRKSSKSCIGKLVVAAAAYFI